MIAILKSDTKGDFNHDPEILEYTLADWLEVHGISTDQVVGTLASAADLNQAKDSERVNDLDLLGGLPNSTWTLASNSLCAISLLLLPQ